ncbi:MAG: hypothetical protein JWN73_3782 [Betaproteobacteria bacterium]|nr:hypothetical protein [Betaproteobacteria bacterium]
MATKAKKAPAKKPAAKKAAARKVSAKKAAPRRIQENHYLPPWVVIGKTIKAAIVGVDPEFKLYTVAYFDAPSGWVQLGFNSEGMAANRRTHYNNIVIESAGN